MTSQGKEKKRLKILSDIKIQYQQNAFMYDGQKRTSMIVDVEKEEWLIEQAERVSLMERALIDEYGEYPKLLEKVERYEKALKEISKFIYSMPNDLHKIAKRALED